MPRATLPKYPLIYAALILVALSACSAQTNMPSTAQSSISPSAGLRVHSRSASPGPILYVANQQSNSVTSYSSITGGFVQTLKGRLHAPVCVILDKDGTVYVGSSKQGSVSVFAQGSQKPNRVIKVGNPVFSLLLDDKQDLYVGGVNYVKVYPHDSSIPSIVINGIAFATSLAFDQRGRLYVTDTGGTANSVLVYKQKSATLLRTISQSISTPVHLAFDSQQNIYVDNAPLGEGWISVYAKDGSFSRYWS